MVKKTFLLPLQTGLVLLLMQLATAALAAFPAAQQVAPNVYAFIGAKEEPSVQNRGAVANQGFIIGDDGIIVIDTGASDEYGEHMLRAIAAISDKPVVLVITTYTGQDHVLGNGAFKRRNIAIVSHRDADQSMAEHCANCLENLKKNLGEDIMANTKVNRPTILIDQSLGVTVSGRPLDILYFGHTHAPGALVIFDRTSKVLFTGDMITIDRLPETREAKIDAWLAAIGKLEKIPATRVVPGHGPVSPPARIKQTAAYLRALQAKVQKIYRDQISLADLNKHSAMPAYAKWAMYDVLQNRNAFNLYLELERQEWGK
jgi:glyoxylase-like metal-dependent hydrolase (beta-lactamase superfamily II)